MVDISHIKNIVVIGAGIMGLGITQSALWGGFEKVVLNDIKKEFIDNGVKKIEEGLKKSESKGKLGEGITTDALMPNLIKEVDLVKAIADADFIFEVVTEDLKIKQKLYKKLGENSPEHTIFASNTSTIRITELGEASNHPEQVIGMHFFLPPYRQRGIEIMKGEKTSDETMEIGVAVGQKLPCLDGKRVIAQLEKESPGFIVNRLLLSAQIYFNWILDQAEENKISWEQIDADAGDLILIGPCELSDYLGLDTSYNSMKSFETILSPDFAPGEVLTKLVSEGHFGKKTGKGFYDWIEGKPKIDKSKKAGFFNPEVMMAIQLNEGCRLLEEGVVKGYKIIDDIMLSGTSMPGPFSAGKRNYEKWSHMLNKLATQIGKEYLRPCKLLKSGNFIKMRK